MCSPSAARWAASISALEAQQGAGHIDGALSTCGIVAGGIRLNNYQLDGEYAMAKLLATTPIQLVNFFPDFNAAIAVGFELQAIANQAQTTPQGRARLELAMAFLNATPDAPGSPAPSLWDADAVEAAQFASEFTGGFPIIAFVNAARPWIEMSAGGNASWTKGENFALLLAHSPYAFTVARLYHEAGLNLFADLASLNAGANIPADPAAIASLQQTSVPTGHLQVPELDMHTIHDPLVPVEMENTYAGVVRAAGSGSLLRQAYVDRYGHCAFSASEIVAGVEAINHRVTTGPLGLGRGAAEARGLREQPRTRRGRVRPVRAVPALRRQRPVRPADELLRGESAAPASRAPPSDMTDVAPIETGNATEPRISYAVARLDARSAPGSPSACVRTG